MNINGCIHRVGTDSHDTACENRKTRIFVIRNDDYGTYLHTSMTKIKAFTSYYGALQYMRFHGLNENIYKVEVWIWEK